MAIPFQCDNMGSRGITARSSSLNRRGRCQFVRLSRSLSLASHGESRRDHELRFESWESAPIRRLTDGLVDVTASKGNFERQYYMQYYILYRDDGIFVPGSLAFDEFKSRRKFWCPGHLFADMPRLGLWKAGSRFLVQQWAHSSAPVAQTDPVAC